MNVDLKIDALRKDVVAEMAKLSAKIEQGKSDTIKWVVSLFIILAIAIFVKPHF